MRDEEHATGAVPNSWCSSQDAAGAAAPAVHGGPIAEVEVELNELAPVAVFLTGDCGDSVRYRDHGQRWQLGTVRSLAAGRPKLPFATQQRGGALYFWDEVAHARGRRSSSLMQSCEADAPSKDAVAILPSLEQLAATAHEPARVERGPSAVGVTGCTPPRQQIGAQLTRIVARIFAGAPPHRDEERVEGRLSPILRELELSHCACALSRGRVFTVADCRHTRRHCAARTANTITYYHTMTAK
eukprot:gene26211-7228_t